MEVAYYDIYGFKMSVEGDEAIINSFNTEYKEFRTEGVEIMDLVIRPSNEDSLPIRLRMATKGIKIDFQKGIVEYEPGIPYDWLLYTIEPMIHWEDKCFLHCGAVSKDGIAILFPAEGGVGKTSMAMHMVQNGYEYLADDWLIIGKDGMAYPFPKTIHVFNYNLKGKTELQKKVLGAKRWYINLKFWALDLLPKIIPHRFVRIVAERLMPIFSVDLKTLNPAATRSKACPIKKVYWLIKDKKATTPYVKKPLEGELTSKMPYITALETNHFYRNYIEWVYSNKPVKWIENKIRDDEHIMKQAFSQAEILELHVPDKINPAEVLEL
jgi:hypothetical protein